MARIHDVGYKYLFSNRTIFRQLLETFVPEAWVREADFEAAETLDKSYISDHFKETESDLLYNVPLRDSEVYIYNSAGVPVYRTPVHGASGAVLPDQFLYGLCEVRQQDPEAAADLPDPALQWRKTMDGANEP